METAPHPVVIEVATGRDDFSFDGEVTGPLHLAEIRRAARTHQGLEPLLAAGAHDLDLQVTAASRTASVVGRSAWGQGTRVLGLENGQRARRRGTCRRGKRSRDGTTIFDDSKPVTSQSTGLLGLVSPPRGRTHEPMRCALSEGTFPMQVSAGNVECGINVELAVVLPDISETDVLGVSDQPGGLMVERCGSVLKWADPERHREAATLRTQTPARGHGRVRHTFGLD